jgi:aspartate/methionine/tyrosine aminotransferase
MPAPDLSHNRFATLPDSPFPRLNALIEGIAPGMAPIVMSLGEPQHPFPDFVSETIAAHAREFGKYPPIAGTPDFRAAVAGWLARRYGLRDAIGAKKPLDPDFQILPVNGTREALFNVALVATPLSKRGARPAILMPNPFYQCYAAAALAAGAEPIYVAATRENGFLPDFARLPEELLARTALIYLCSPANPQGAVASLDYLKDLLRLARRHGALLAIDECYAEIYDRDAPAGALQAAIELSGSLDNLIVFHSLSKRSSVPGLRSGFCAGERDFMVRFRNVRNIASPQVPLPIMAASAALWNDESHVTENRERYRRKIDAAERVFGNRFGFYRPAGGFFLWLDVGDGERAARDLWAKAGVKVLPGAYLSREDSFRLDPDAPARPADAATANPGTAYIRVALVDDEARTEEALKRMAEVL